MPNCRHSLATYIPGYDIIPDSERNRKMPRDTKLYEAEQAMRRNERAIREWKRRESQALDPVERQKAAAKVAQYQARNRVLVKSTDGLYRNYWREKPGFKVTKDTRWGDLKYNKRIYDN